VLAAVAVQGEDDALQRGRASAGGCLFVRIVPPCRRTVAVSPMTDDETVLGERERVEILSRLQFWDLPVLPLSGHG
jgi:hypothetical protein